MEGQELKAPSPLEETVLYAVLDIQGEGAYTFSLADRIAQVTGKELAPGALYTVLTRLGDKGFVESELGEPTPERGGRRKRLYRVNSEGIRFLAFIEEQRAKRRQASMIGNLPGEVSRGG